MCGAAVILGPQDAAEPLRFLLPRPEGARDLYKHVGVRQVNGKIPHLGEHQTVQLVTAEAAVDQLSLLLWCLASDERSADLAGDSLYLGQVLAHNEDAPLGVAGQGGWRHAPPLLHLRRASRALP